MKEKTITIPEKSLGDLIKQGFDLLEKREDEEKHPNQLILFENQKKAVCEFYECSDSHDNQYPDCDFKPNPCQLARLQELFWFINQERNCQ